MSNKDKLESTLMLKKYARQVQEQLQGLAAKKEMTAAAKEMGVQLSRLSEMASGSREITAYYVGKMIKKGIISVEHILQGRPFKDLPKEEQRFLFSLDLDPEMIDLLILAKEQDKDIKPLVKMMLGIKD